MNHSDKMIKIKMIGKSINPNLITNVHRGVRGMNYYLMVSCENDLYLRVVLPQRARVTESHHFRSYLLP